MATSNAIESIDMTAEEPLFRRHRITVDEYLRMEQVGLLAPDARVELIEGEIIDMPPIGTEHSCMVDTLSQLFLKTLDGRVIVRTQGCVQLDQHSQPQPDLALLKPRADRYRHKHPSGADTFLAVEVSHSTLLYDRQIKVPLYAQHGVPEVWIVDVRDKQVHFFRSPVEGEYTAISTINKPGLVRAPGLPGIALDLSQLFD